MNRMLKLTINLILRYLLKDDVDSDCMRSRGWYQSLLITLITFLSLKTCVEL